MLARTWLVAFALSGCGHDTTHRLADAPPAVVDGVAIDAAPIACTYVAVTATSPALTFTGSGGSLQSYGCAPIDPTYWMAGANMAMTVTFAQPQDRPAIRVWGMNTDDTASIQVNGAAYTLDATTASLAPKVTCGVSPGPDGVAFVAGNLAGANTPSDGNFSYQDVTIEHAAVSSITITSLTGAGWGFAGASVGACTTP